MDGAPGRDTREDRRPGAPLLAVAGLSARALAASARRAGFRVAALDCFGDRDTRENAHFWFNIAAPGSLGIDRRALRDALDQVAGLEGAFGWVAGGGLESVADQAEQLSTRLRFFGNAPDAVRAVRNPARFFGLLAELGIDHPPFRLDAPDAAAGWLYKQTTGCGGWHVAAAETQGADAARHGYFQQRRAGTPMSALFLANGRQASVIGFAAQRIVSLPGHEFVYAGAVAPADVPAATARAVDAMIAAIVVRTGLVGLNGIDFLLDGERPCVLEVNPRPTATVALYEEAEPGRWPRGLMAKHLEACMAAPCPTVARAVTDGTAAHATVFTPHAVRVSAQLSDRLAQTAWCADVPCAGAVIAAGQPFCTMVVRTASAEAATACLDAHQVQIDQWLGACTESSEGSSDVHIAQ